ncbi:hypothetical protein H311_04577 [Anncaliia algerae PRA109]|nr:hypothetical protein H311_04577 [Anncaliia algerae PRA109]
MEAYIVLTLNKSVNRSMFCAISTLVVIAYSYKVVSYKIKYFKEFIVDKLGIGRQKKTYKFLKIWNNIK